MVNFDDFAKLQIKIGTIIEIEKVPDADKLLKIIIDFGDEKRQIMSGIAKFYPDYNILIGKQVPVLVNLEPRKFRGFESQGMIIMADVVDSEGKSTKVVQLHPAENIPNGSTVR